MTHCGLCHSDLHLIDNDWGKSTYPLVPGHEVVGKIVKKGTDVPLPLGARVGVSWYLSACLECAACLKEDTQACPKKIATCIGHYGGFATHMTADARFVHPIPEGLDSAIAAPLLCAGATVYAPLRRFKVQALHRIAIIGIGGLGHLAIQFASAFGSHVTAISSSMDKKEEALSFGANDFTTVDKLTVSAPFDYIFSTVQADLDWDLICSLLTYSGTLCILGRPSKNISVNIASLSNRRSITTSSVANRPLLNEMLAFAAEHQIKPKIELMQMAQINEAIERVRQNKARYRIVLQNK